MPVYLPAFRLRRPKVPARGYAAVTERLSMRAAVAVDAAGDAGLVLWYDSPREAQDTTRAGAR